MKNEKTVYQTPEIKIFPLKREDMISASGNDSFDNWSSDIFGE